MTDTTSPIQVTVDATTIASDGTVTFYAKHADAADNASACSTANVAYTYDGTAPTVSSGSTGYYSDAGATNAITAPQKSGASVYTKVTFSEDMKHVKSNAAAARPALSYSIGGSDTRYHILDNADALASGDCKPNHASETDEYICLYTVASGNNGAFAVKAGTDSVDKAGNALAAAYTHAQTIALDNTAPAAPVSLNAAPGDTKVTLTWGNPSPADATIAKWQYRHKTTGAYGNWTDVSGGASKRTVEVTGLMNGTAYTFQVRAVDTAANDGAAGTTSAVTPTATDGTAPTVLSASTGYYDDAAATNTLTGPLKAGADIYTKVTFSEDMKHVKNDGASARPELFYRIGGTDEQYDILNNGDTLASGDCKPNHASNTNVYICRYTVASGNNGVFTLKAGTNSVDRADNALAAVYTHSAALVLDTTAPAAPVSLAAAPGDRSVRLTWREPSPADATIVKWQYRQKSTGAYGNWQDVLGGGLARWVEVGSLSNGTAYTFQVRAVDASDNEGAAGTTAAVTPAPAPTVVAASTGYYSDAMLASALSGTVKSGTSIYFKVTFSEDMKHTKSSTSGLPEIRGLISLPGLAMNAQRLGILDAGDALTNANCKPNHASNTDVYICHVVTVSSLDAEGTRIGLRVGAESVNKAGNALASVYNHASQLTIDNRGPAVEFPPGAPTVGTAASITLKDPTSKVAKYGIVEVDGASTTAVGCDDPSSTGDNFSTTAVSPAATPKVVMHTPVTVGKKICVYAEDGVGNSHAQLWTTAIAATDNTAPPPPSGRPQRAATAAVESEQADRQRRAAGERLPGLVQVRRGAVVRHRAPPRRLPSDPCGHRDRGRLQHDTGLHGEDPCAEVARPELAPGGRSGRRAGDAYEPGQPARGRRRVRAVHGAGQRHRSGAPEPVLRGDRRGLGGAPGEDLDGKIIERSEIPVFVGDGGVAPVGPRQRGGVGFRRGELEAERRLDGRLDEEAALGRPADSGLRHGEGGPAAGAGEGAGGGDLVGLADGRPAHQLPAALRLRQLARRVRPVRDRALGRRLRPRRRHLRDRGPRLERPARAARPVAGPARPDRRGGAGRSGQADAACGRAGVRVQRRLGRVRGRADPV